MPTILLTERVHPDAVILLRQQPGYHVIDASDARDDEVHQALGDVAAIGVRIRRIDAAVLAAAPKLRVIAKHGVGTDNIDHDVCAQRGILVLNTPDANKVAVAEHAFAMMLALVKQLARYEEAARASDWKFRDQPSACELAGRTLAVIGFGRSGQELARRARAFDMRVFAWGRSVDRARAEALGVDVARDLDMALAVADFVSLHVPKPNTGGALIGRREFALMKPGAMLVNCARGGVVDESALAAALRSQHLGGAGIDVFDQEPPPLDHPLLARDLPNVLVTPHSAGSTKESARRMALEMAANIIAGLSGRHDPSHIVRIAVRAQ